MYRTSFPWSEDVGLVANLERRGVDRREFLKYCAEMAAILGLSAAMSPRIAAALEKLKRPP